MRNLISGFGGLLMVSLSIILMTGEVRSVDIQPGIDESENIIVSVTGGRIRNKPSLDSEILEQMKVGAVLPLLEENKGWFKVRLSDSTVSEEEQKSGWISKTISEKFDQTKPDSIFKKIADRYFSRKSLTFKTAAELFEFLGPAADDAKTYEIGGYLRLKRLMALSEALRNIRPERQNKSPFKEFLEKYKADVVYSEPAGQWMARSEKFWQLHQRYKKYKIGETIAWEAARNPIPGECEGYINCYLYLLRVTNGEYLNFYPNGKYSRRALMDTINMLDPIVADIRRKTVYYTTSDISDRAEFNKYLAQLRTIISKTPFIEKHKALKQINLIAEGHR